ncbi:MAG: N-acetylmuramoyl-L-alanine amidase [Clostridium sp.]
MINQQLINQSKYNVKCPYAMTPVGICVHNTANDASAKNERDNVNRPDNNEEVSFHVAIDDIQAIQLVPFDRNTWHAGDGGSGRGNRNHISIEICYSKSGGERFTKAEQRAAKVIAKLLKDYGWGIDKVKKHQDFSNKYCPHRTLDIGWTRFINMIKSELTGSSTPSIPSTSDLFRVRRSWGDAASQKGAYSSLENAKNECNKYAGYGVYDNKGIKVYPTNAPSPTRPPVQQDNDKIVKEYGEKGYGIPRCTVNVRNQPTTIGNDPVDTYAKNEKIKAYDKVVITENYTWISYASTSGTRRYIAVKDNKTKERFVDCY